MRSALTILGRVLCGPPDWIVDHFPTRARRAFGFWTFVLAVAGSFFFGRQVLYVTALSVVALIPNFTSETPVEIEEAVEEGVEEAVENDEGPP